MTYYGGGAIVYLLAYFENPEIVLDSFRIKNMIYKVFFIFCLDKSASVRAEWGVGLRHKGLRAQRRVKGREREGKRGGMK